ncbi:azaleucine resistance protein AzlC [Halolamina pelagica]|uniref:Azaleucine resistance protein AzlC n=1 Tax=Halolamina pelagica TaxID=699431 RepID=A0A0P7HET3_9EURY|nr:AzlC family ABC transporter permease [Halolamina pelagica]KPN32215.1 azaleucine resistance protein AzlC [Halolamina pelagica]
MTSDTDGRTAVTFSAAGARAGFRRCLPVAAGVGAYGLVFGVVARQSGLSVAEAALMSATVFAGAAQLIAVELWADPIPVAAVLTTTVVVNARYVLMGAALRPWFARLRPSHSYGSVFFLIDETWAVTMGELSEGRGQGAFLVGSGVAVWLFWVAATVAGASVGAAVGEPSRYGLDFVLPAIFIAIAVGLWEGKSTLLPWVVAFAVAIVAAGALPGRWYILAGGVAGSLVEVIRVGR